MEKEEANKMTKFIDSYEGELIITHQGIYHNDILVAHVSNKQFIINEPFRGDLRPHSNKMVHTVQNNI